VFGFPNPGAYFGPSNMLYCYKNMEVPVGGGIATVAVNKYKNANHGDKSSGCNAALKVKDALRQVAPDAYSRAGGTVAYVDVFMGKGSPWAIAGVLETFGVYQEKFVKTFGGQGKGTPQGKAAAILADDSISWEETMQQLCDAFIGLDCNGFVGNWLKVVQPDFKLNQNSRSEDVRRKAVTYRTKPEEFEYWDVMCYVGNEHIAAINGDGSVKGRSMVVQSAGGGPRINEFGFVRTGAKTFKLASPTPDDIGNDFYVVSLW